jgi:hypothetical protein
MADTDTKVEDKTSAADEAKARKEREAAEEKAAKQNAADIETFLSFHRGEMLVRDERGCLDVPAALAAAHEAAKAEDEDKKD